ncbi:hypothetical protein [Arthrobacter alpinus]|uniref:hypothetical protein n=1 Tax=Arthrobacter alpinus TaxID=656366 RepID=UPI0014804F6B|nr:hypothetical protein [Arthrobacter alpinus]
MSIQDPQWGQLPAVDQSEAKAGNARSLAETAPARLPTTGIIRPTLGRATDAL